MSNVKHDRTSSELGFAGRHVGHIERDGAGAGNVSGKVRPQGVNTQATGPVFTCNDPAVGKTFGEKRGKTSGKPASGNTVIHEGEGPTITHNGTPIEQPFANVEPRITKQLAEKASTFRPLETAGELTASQSGSGGPADHAYFLSKSYDKKGAKSTIGTKVKPFEGA